MKHVYVEFEKMLSDGNYGRERAVIQFSQDIEDDQDEQHVATLLLSQARNRLNHELGKSESLTVRRAINPPPRLCGECQQPLSDDEDYRHPACDEIVTERRKREGEERRERYRREREEQEARWREQHELVAVGAPSDGGEDLEDGDHEDDEPL